MVLFFTILVEVPQDWEMKSHLKRGNDLQKIVKWQHDKKQNNPKSAIKKIPV